MRANSSTAITAASAPTHSYLLPPSVAHTGTALKMLLLPPELLPTASRATSCVFHTASFFAAIEHVKEMSNAIYKSYYTNPPPYYYYDATRDVCTAAVATAAAAAITTHARHHYLNNTSTPQAAALACTRSCQRGLSRLRLSTLHCSILRCHTSPPPRAAAL